MSVLLNWYRMRKSFDIRTESARAVYYVKAKLYWQNIADHSPFPVWGRVARHYDRKLIRRYGIFVGNHCKVGEGLRLPHPNGIVIGEYVKIGNNCTIYQQTTLGAKSIEACKKRNVRKQYPVLGNGVIVYAGAKVIGAVKVGENTCVGVNALLLQDTEKGSTYAGIPAKRIK